MLAANIGPSGFLRLPRISIGHTIIIIIIIRSSRPPGTGRPRLSKLDRRRTQELEERERREREEKEREKERWAAALHPPI